MSAPAARPLKLDDVAALLQSAPRRNGSLILSADALQAYEVGDVLDAIGATELALDDPVIAPAGNTLVASGKAQLFGVDVDTRATFAVPNGALAFALHAELPDHAIELPGLPWATVTELALDLSAAGPSLAVPLVSGAFTGAIRLDGVKDPITVTLGPEIGSGAWLLRATHIPLPDPFAILESLLAGHDAKALTPPTLALDGFEVEELACRFDPDGLSPRSLAVTVGAPGATWRFADHLPALKGVYVSLGLDFGDDGTSVSFGAGATIELGTLVDLPVRVWEEPGQWRVGIVGAHGFPSLGELIETVSPATKGFLPSAVSTLKMDTATLELTLAAGDGAVRSIFFGTRLADRWWLIQDHLGLDQVALDLLVEPAAGSVIGSFTGTIAADSVQIPVAVSKPAASAPLTVELATSAPPPVSGLSSLSGVAGGNDLTAHLPTGIGAGAFSVRRLSMAFAADTYAPSTLDLDVASDGPWAFPGLSGFDVRDLELVLHVGWPGPSVTGSIGGTIELDGFALRIAAGRAGAADPWAFSGSMVLPAGQTSLAIGPFIQGIAAKLGALDVPASLAGATLSSADVTFDTAGDLSFDCKGQLPVDGQPLALELRVKVERSGGGFRATYDGSVKVAGQEFDLNVSTDPAVTRLVAAYTHDRTKPGVDVGALLTEVWPGAPGAGLKVDVRDVLFALATDTAGTRAAFALDLDDIDLSGLPLVGALLADAANVKDLQLVAATAAPADGDVAAWNRLVPAEARPLPAGGIARGVAISAAMTFAGAAAPLSLPAAAAAGGGGTAVAPQGDGTKWFPVQRSFGPMYFGRVGARYEAGALWLVLDASLSLGGLSVSLMGLAVGSPLSTFAPEFHLDGLGLDFSEGGVEIAGAFLAVPEKQLGPGVAFQYDGAAVVRGESFTLAAVGSYAVVESHPSLFLFAELKAPLGGPPAFYVTGLMGGFGYNRALRIPGQDEVHAFPFLAGFDAKVGDGTPLGMLAVLEGAPNPWLTEGVGQNWLAVGVTFTSFELVESRALLIAEFGRELLFALLGLSKLRLPQEGTEEFAYVELELEAILRPQAGFFGLTAVLSPNSFVIAPECRLTGGFAFYVWFGGDHAGDFVLTLGGYHPSFDRPDWYPQEPRLALTWPVDDLVTVEGDAYFALTPSCVMGGGALRVLMHDGDLRAWLTASADFLISWRPFRYEVEIGVSIGVSYRLELGALSKTLSAELGAHVTLWGPPTGGTAHVSWYFISFDIAFGAGRPTRDDVVDSWSYVAALLPSEDLCKVSCESGLLAGTSHTGPWRVRADGLQLASECAVPATTLQVAAGTTPAFDKPEQAPAIRPLAHAALDATHTLHVKDPAGNEIDLHGDGWTIEARTRSVPAALWGAPLAGDPPTPAPSSDLVEHQWIGLVVSPPAVRAPKESVSVDMQAALASVEVAPAGALPLGTAENAAPGAPSDQATKAVAGVDAAASARAAIRAALGALDPGTDDPLGPYAAAAAAGLFPTAPMLAGSAS